MRKRGNINKTMSHFSTTGKHIRRSPYQAIAAILTMTLTFFVAAIFLLTALGSQAVLSYFEKKPQITAFFADTKTEEDIRLLDEKLKTTGKVEATRYISKEEALSIYREQNKNDPLLLEMVTADILPASLEISAREPKHLGDLAKILQEELGIEDVIYQKDVIESLISWTEALRAGGAILVSVLGTVSLLVLLTVIGMKIALRREEIEILKLLGATNWYVRWPFLLEGGLYGLIAAFLAWSASYLLLLYSTPFLITFLSGIPLLPVSILFMLGFLASMLVSGFLVGALGSFLALLRYL